MGFGHQDGGLLVEDANGTLIVHCKWAVRQDLERYIAIDVFTEDGNWAEDGQLIIPGLCNYFYFVPNREDEKDAKIEFYDVPLNSDISTAWRYHLVATK